MMNQEQQHSQLKQLIAKGKIQGYLTYAEVNDHLPSDIVDPEQIEDIIGMINEMGIQVYETAPDEDSLITDSAAVTTDDEDDDLVAALPANDVVEEAVAGAEEEVKGLNYEEVQEKVEALRKQLKIASA